jgi:hypothetical protein
VLHRKERVPQSDLGSTTALAALALDFGCLAFVGERGRYFGRRVDDISARSCERTPSHDSALLRSKELDDLTH